MTQHIRLSNILLYLTTYIMRVIFQSKCLEYQNRMQSKNLHNDEVSNIKEFYSFVCNILPPSNRNVCKHTFLYFRPLVNVIYHVLF